MSPNLVFQQGISHHENTLRPSMSISTFGTLHGWFAINHQWSIHFFIHRNGNTWICTTNILSSQFTAIQQHNKWVEQLPTQLPSETAFHRSNPTTSLWGASSGSSVFTSSVGLLSPWVVADLIWSRWKVEKKESGRSDWAAGGRKSQHSANAWRWRWEFLWLRYYSLFSFPLRESLGNCFFLESEFRSLSTRIYARCQMNSVFSANFMSPNLVFQQGISHHKNTLPPSMSISTFGTLHGWFAINHQQSIHFFIHWNGIKWICTTNIDPHNLQPYSTTSGLEQLPTQLPNETAFHRSNPTTSLWGASSGSSVFTSSVGLLSAWMVADLIWSRWKVEKKESGRSDWAAGGRKSQHSANAWRWRWEFLWLRYYSLFFSLAKIAW